MASFKYLKKSVRDVPAVIGLFSHEEWLENRERCPFLCAICTIFSAECTIFNAEFIILNAITCVSGCSSASQWRGKYAKRWPQKCAAVPSSSCAVICQNKLIIIKHNSLVFSLHNSSFLIQSLSFWKNHFKKTFLRHLLDAIFQQRPALLDRVCF